MAERFERLDFEFGFERLDFVVVIGLILAYGLWWFASVGLGYSSSSCDVGLGLANGFPIDKLHDE